MRGERKAGEGRRGRRGEEGGGERREGKGRERKKREGKEGKRKGQRWRMRPLSTTIIKMHKGLQYSVCVILWSRLTEMLIIHIKICHICDGYIVKITENWGKFLLLPTTFYYPIDQG